MVRQKTLLAEANTSAKRNLISVGGCADTPVHVDAAGNTDGKRPCLGNGQTVLMRTPTQAEFVECWSEAIIRNGLPPALGDTLALLYSLLIELFMLPCTQLLLQWTDNFVGGTWIRSSRRISGQ